MAWGDVLGHPRVRKALQEGEERLGRTVGKLLADERVAGGVQRLLSGAIRAREAVERGVERALRAANLPTRGDVDALRTRIEELEAMIEGRAHAEPDQAPRSSVPPPRNGRGRRRSGDE